MKVAGLIITTIVEYVEVDIGDAEMPIPDFEMSELFMKLCLALSPHKVLSKDVRYVPTGRVREESPETSGIR